MVTVSLERRYACSIYSIFPLCLESNVLEKSTTNSVASFFLLLLLLLLFFTRTPSMI